ncbi:homoserine dehydrogenase [Pelobacter propionicus]|uniref:Homoserine dehydrogenase n=1 Tax=Pelobacter propionicus (strain DSM 2379 / NBRC 103807 / OttBd1) TaxID=338966 RepID=A1ANJ4_PELPD|nr:homoserine dehydrogenase [Pelobacter propionicus]ABK98914.1 homoserine dehydrogenase [Pelobacter propionicus DSM 2379]
MNDIKVGLIGFGNIGAGVVKLLTNNAEVIRGKVGAGIVLKRIADRDITTDRGVAVDPSCMTTDVNDIFDDPEISVVIELVGGYEPAKSFVLRAIEKGKHIVTANKALLALHGQDIFAAAARKNVEVQFEAAVGGGIPVLTAIKGNMAANNFGSVFGIMNGTCNYILTRMTQEGADFADMLTAAQELGYAEPDPTFDIEGVDTAHKLAILVSLCFGTRIDFNAIHTEGISRISGLDVKFARDFGYRIKLLAIGKLSDGKVEARVHPTMIPLHNPMADVNGVFNAIRLTGDFVGAVMFYGRGAGQDPTASAIVGDLIGLSRSMLAGAGRRMAPLGLMDEQVRDLPVKPMADIVSKYMLRFSTRDIPGVLGTITGALGKHGISISSMVQTAHEANDNAPVPIVIMTHEAVEGSVQAALEEIDRLDFVCEKTSFIRIEDNLE